eukprot:scaffold1313_cov250-Pinguiococcus_pyrenoidosus.AAC.4
MPSCWPSRGREGPCGRYHEQERSYEAPHGDVLQLKVRRGKPKENKKSNSELQNVFKTGSSPLPVLPPVLFWSVLADSLQIAWAVTEQ